jgi:hypothetical protein
MNSQPNILLIATETRQERVMCYFSIEIGQTVLIPVDCDGEDKPVECEIMWWNSDEKNF